MTADAVWTILVELAGAREGRRADFVHHAERTPAGAFEYRFMGVLGFGGKAYLDSPGGWRASCYPEDETPERLAVVAAVNARLAEDA